ncbi:MAG: HD domain-containing protein [Planctomycetaceae bacterium]|jgi:3'-5' exoribonuclease|nr:HD domain-containing protein [Planctomycetaceae bacterium]
MLNSTIVSLHELEPNQDAVFFAILAEKETLETKGGKPYLRITVKDARREVKFPVWSADAVYPEIKKIPAGTYCKMQAVYRVSQFGPQLEIRKIRPAEISDEKDGFDPLLLRPHSSLPLDAMWDELKTFAAKQLGKSTLLNIVTKILTENRAFLEAGVASRHHHHNYIGGLLEHTLSVSKIAAALVDHYQKMYPHKKDEIARPIVVTAAVLHDIGKIREYEPEIGSPVHSVEGELLGHAILGRDIFREAAKEFGLDAPTQMHIEHIIVSHQRYADWGAAKPGRCRITQCASFYYIVLQKNAVLCCKSGWRINRDFLDGIDWIYEIVSTIILSIPFILSNFCCAQRHGGHGESFPPPCPLRLRAQLS